jgi:hypothetical protein
MRTFTLDTNCLAAVDESRTEAVAVRVLAEAHAAGTAHVAVVGISASENQQAEGYIRNFADFREQLRWKKDEFYETCMTAEGFRHKPGAYLCSRTEARCYEQPPEPKKPGIQETVRDWLARAKEWLK